MRLKDKVAVVTGAASGLGRAVATRFLLEGARLVAVDIASVAAHAAFHEARSNGATMVFREADVSEETEVQRLVDCVLEQFGRIDVLYNNAAVLLRDQDGPPHELSADVWDQTMRVNLRSFFLCSKYTIPAMLKQGGGSIIHVGSPTGLFGCAPNLTAYSASKGGILGLTRVMAASYAPYKIRVNSVIPGAMNTPMNSDLMSDAKACDELLATIPMRRFGNPEEVSGLAVFLASDESSYCTGGIYTCDGGLTAI